MSVTSTRPQPLAAPSPTLEIGELEELMRAVNETAQNLHQTHVSLQEEVARLKAELAEANAQLRRSRSLAALGEMAAGIAHEIRNPLGAIQLNVQLLAADVAHAPRQVELCEKIGRSVTGLDAIVRDVLLFAKDMTLRPSVTSACELIGQALGGCEALLERGGVELEVPEGGQCPLTVDVTLMVQALGNVIRNAVEAMVEAERAPRRLQVTADRRRLRVPGGAVGDRVVITVEDTGPGIPADALNRLFNPFFTTRATGTGLGLAIVHRIVDAHGGHIRVGNLDGGGARVELCLPREPGSSRPDEPAAIEVTGAAAAGARPSWNGSGQRFTDEGTEQAKEKAPHEQDPRSRR